MVKTIAIDGPSASGKSSVSKGVAEKLGYLYVDSGALYRGVTWQALRKGALGRRRVFDTLGRQFLPGRFDPPDFALKLARKDVALACEVGREFDVPMRLAHLTLMEMTEALNRGWEGRDSRVAMTLQTERAGVDVRVSDNRIAEILAEDS